MKKIMHEPEDGCGGCPFLAADEDQHTACGAEMWRRIPNADTAPDWCPLRAGAVAVHPFDDRRVCDHSGGDFSPTCAECGDEEHRRAKP